MTERVFVLLGTVPDGESVVRATLAWELNRLMKTGAVGYQDVIAGLLAVSGSMVATFTRVDADTAAVQAAAVVDSAVRRSMADERLTAIRTAVLARSARH